MLTKLITSLALCEKHAEVPKFSSYFLESVEVLRDLNNIKGES